MALAEAAPQPPQWGFGALEATSLPAPPESWRERIQLGALPVEDVHTQGENLEAVVGASLFRELQEDTQVRGSVLAKPNVASFLSVAQEVSRKSQQSKARSSRVTVVSPLEQEDVQWSSEERRLQQLKDHATRLTKRNGRQLLLEDPDGGEVFEHELEYIDQKVVILYYLSRPPSQRPSHMSECLLRFFFDKPLFDRMTVSQLEESLAEAQLHRYRRGALVLTPNMHVVHVVEGTLGKTVVRQVGTEFRSSAGRHKRKQLMKWMASIKDGTVECQTHILSGDSIVSKSDDNAAPSVEGVDSFVSADGLTRKTAGSVHCDVNSGDWYCYVALSRHLIILTAKLPCASLAKTETAVEEAKQLERSPSTADQILKLVSRYQEDRKAARRGSMKRGHIRRSSSRILSFSRPSGKQKDHGAVGILTMEAMVDRLGAEFCPRLRMILHAGEEVRCCYILVSGQVRVTCNPPDSLGPKARSIEVARLTEAGTWMGVLACYESRRERFNYVVVSQKGARVRAIPVETFRHWWPHLSPEFWDEARETEEAWLQTVKRVVDGDTSQHGPEGPECLRQPRSFKYQIPRECFLQCTDLDKVSKSRAQDTRMKLEKLKRERKLQHRERVFRENDMVYEGKPNVTRYSISSALTKTALKGQKPMQVRRKSRAKEDMLVDWLMSEKASDFQNVPRTMTRRFSNASRLSGSSRASSGKNSSAVGIRFGRSSIYMPSDFGDSEDRDDIASEDLLEEGEEEEQTEDEEGDTSGSETWMWDASDQKRDLHLIEEFTERLEEEKSIDNLAAERSLPSSRPQSPRIAKHRDSYAISSKFANHKDSLAMTPLGSKIRNARNSLLKTPLRTVPTGDTTVVHLHGSQHRASMEFAVITMGDATRQVAENEQLRSLTQQFTRRASNNPTEDYSGTSPSHASRRGSHIDGSPSKRLSTSPPRLGVQRQVAFASRRASDISAVATPPDDKGDHANLPESEPNKQVLGFSEDDLNATEGVADLGKLLEQRLETFAESRNQNQHRLPISQALQKEALTLSPRQQLDSQISETDGVTRVTSPPMETPPSPLKHRPGSAGQPGFLRARRLLSASSRGPPPAERPKTPDASSPSLRAWRNGNIGACSLTGGMRVAEQLELKMEEKSSGLQVLSTGVSSLPAQISSPPARCRLVDVAPTLASTPPKLPASKEEKSAELQGLRQAVKALIFTS